MNLHVLRRLAFRLGQAVPVLLVVAVIAFTVMHLLPGDPAVIIAGPEAGAEAVERIRVQLGLDRPIHEQLFVWLVHLAQGEFGSSPMLYQSVLRAPAGRMPVTLSLT